MLYSPSFMNEYDQLLDQLQEFLEYQREEGIVSLDVSPETLAVLQSVPTLPVPVKQVVAERPKPRRLPPTPPPPPPPKPEGIQVNEKSIDSITRQIGRCSECDLKNSRTQPVPGEGKTDQPDILFIGECPGAVEDAQGRPFMDESGQLLDKMIVAMGYTREDVYITTVVKCMPPDERIPHKDERKICNPYLKSQIKLLKPKVIVALGKTVCEVLTGKPIAMNRVRGQWIEFEGIPVMQTFHPGYLEKVPSKKRDAWSDLKDVMAKLGKPLPTKGK